MNLFNHAPDQEVGNWISIGGIIFAGVLLIYARWAIDFALKHERQHAAEYEELHPPRWPLLHRWRKRREQPQQRTGTGTTA